MDNLIPRACVRGRRLAQEKTFMYIATDRLKAA